MEHAYHALTADGEKASDCIGCKQCEKNCFQELKITDYLAQVMQVFEK